MLFRSLEEIGSYENVDDFIAGVKAGDQKLMGFGHRVYKKYDPRATLVKKVADDVFSILGKEPLIEIAVELERIALSDEFFIKRNLYPNVDFYSGIIMLSIGIPLNMFTVIFAMARTVGWVSQWNEMMGDDSSKISRPRQCYLGATKRDYIPMDER